MSHNIYPALIDFNLPKQSKMFYILFVNLTFNTFFFQSVLPPVLANITKIHFLSIFRLILWFIYCFVAYFYNYIVVVCAFMATALMIRLNCVKLGYTRDQLIISTILDLSYDKIDKWIFLQIKRWVLFTLRLYY